MYKIIATSLAVGLVLAFGSLAQAELTGMDIGGPAETGSTTILVPGSDYTLVGSGADIWGTSDQFHYASEAYTGDFTATVLASSVRYLYDPTLTHDWAKAGIMARETLDANSAHVSAIRSGHNGTDFAARSSTGANSSHIGFGSGDVDGHDVWLRLSREGNWWAASWAEDTGGVPGAWSNQNLINTVMPSTIELGLALTSHDNNVDRSETATFTGYTVGPLTDFPAAATLTLPTYPAGGMGYMGIREVYLNGNIGDQGAAHASLNNSDAATVVDYTASMLNIQDSSGRGHFDNDAQLGVVTAGHATYGGVDNIALMARGTIRIPASGEYTFGVNSDDGFTLQIPGYDFKHSGGAGQLARYAEGDALQFYGGRGASDTLGVLNLPAGDHPFVLTWAEGAGGAAVELFAAAGNHSAYSHEAFNLVGGPVIPAQDFTEPPALTNGWSVDVIYDDGNGAGISGIANAITAMEAFWAGTLTPEVAAHADGVVSINYADPDGGGGGRGFPQIPFPGDTPGTAEDAFALGATGDLVITEDGNYSFLVLGDDGARFLMPGTSDWAASGIAAVDTSGEGIYIGGCCNDGIGTVNLTAGTYSMELIWNEIGGGAYVGVWGRYEDQAWFLLGDTTSLDLPEVAAGLQLVPEPSTLTLLLGLAALSLLGYRRKR